MRSTALLLVLMLAAVPVTAQEIMAGTTAQPSIESRVEDPPSAESPDLEVPESLKETLRLLRTPGLHPEIMEVLGLDEAGISLAAQESNENPEEDDGGMPLWAKVLIGAGIAVGLILAWGFSTLS